MRLLNFTAERFASTLSLPLLLLVLCVPLRAQVAAEITGAVTAPWRAVTTWLSDRAPNGALGNVGRNTLIGPGLETLDISLLKDTRLAESLKAKFSVEFFHVLTRANFNTPNLITFTQQGGTPATTAGAITSTATSARQIQFALKLLW